MSELVEAGLRLVLDQEIESKPLRKLPTLPSWTSGGALVDISSRDALNAVMDDG